MGRNLEQNQTLEGKKETKKSKRVRVKKTLSKPRSYFLDELFNVKYLINYVTHTSVPSIGRTFLGRPNKMYFGSVARPEHTEHTGLLTATSQDPLSAAATSMPSSPSSKGRYQGLGHTPAPHSISAPAGFTNSSWEDGDNSPPSAGDSH